MLPFGAVKDANPNQVASPLFQTTHFGRANCELAHPGLDLRLRDERRRGQWIFELDPEVERFVERSCGPDRQAILAGCDRAMIIGESDPPSAAQSLQVVDRLRRGHSGGWC